MSRTARARSRAAVLRARRPVGRDRLRPLAALSAAQDAAQRTAYRRLVSHLVVPLQTPTGQAIGAELRRGAERAARRGDRRRADGRAAAGWSWARRRRVPAIASLGWSERLAELGDEGYVIRQARVGSHLVIVVASQSEIGALYGAFHLLRLIQTGRVDASGRHRRAAAAAAPAAEPLGQPRRHHRARLRRPVALELGGAARPGRSARRSTTRARTRRSASTAR